jgi:hypothetical protein
MFVYSWVLIYHRSWMAHAGHDLGFSSWHASSVYIVQVEYILDACIMFLATYQSNRSKK